MTTLHDENKIRELRNLTKEIQDVTYQLAFARKNNISYVREQAAKDNLCYIFNLKLDEYIKYIREKTIDEAIKIVHEIDFGGVTRGKADIIQNVKYKTITNLAKLKN